MYFYILILVASVTAIDIRVGPVLAPSLSLSSPNPPIHTGHATAAYCSQR